jgi:hypothetical protein
VSEQTTTAALPHERKITEGALAGATEDIAESYRFSDARVGEYYELHDAYRDLPIEESYHAAIGELRRAARDDEAVLGAMVRLLRVCGARERHMAQGLARDAFSAGYSYAVEAITGTPPAA